VPAIGRLRPFETQALEKAALNAEQAAQAAAQFAEQVPLGRRGKPEEVAAVVLLLTSDESSYITGGIWRSTGDGTGLNWALKTKRWVFFRNIRRFDSSCNLIDERWFYVLSLWDDCFWPRLCKTAESI
jgi:hypothetical protein